MNWNFSKFVSTFILLLIVEYGGMYPSLMFKWQKWLDWENKLGYIIFSFQIEKNGVTLHLGLWYYNGPNAVFKA